MSAPREINSRIRSILPSQAPIISPLPMRLPMKSGDRPASSQASACRMSPSSICVEKAVAVGKAVASARAVAGKPYPSVRPIPIIIAATPLFAHCIILHPSLRPTAIFS